MPLPGIKRGLQRQNRVRHRLLIELAAVYDQGLVLQVAEIAQRQGIPDRYLEQMLTSLRRGKILRSIRAPKAVTSWPVPPQRCQWPRWSTAWKGKLLHVAARPAPLQSLRC